MRKLIFIFMIFASLVAYADKKPLLEDYNQVVAAAREHLQKLMEAPAGELYLFAQKNNISGQYEFDITIHEKGLVATVFVKSNEGGTVKSQGLLKDYVKSIEFNFKMPKGKDYKFSYTFQFN